MDGPVPEDQLLKASIAKASPEVIADAFKQAVAASPELLRQLQELAAGAGAL
jgi:hypothetical protein